MSSRRPLYNASDGSSESSLIALLAAALDLTTCVPSGFLSGVVLGLGGGMDRSVTQEDCVRMFQSMATVCGYLSASLSRVPFDSAKRILTAFEDANSTMNSILAEIRFWRACEPDERVAVKWLLDQGVEINLNMSRFHWFSAFTCKGILLWQKVKN